MQLIDRYMSAVAFHLPAKRRDEITRELRANILDKLENLEQQLGHRVTEADVSAVLKALGHPQQIANSFLPPHQLVTAELFPLFKQVLRYGVIFMFVLELIKFGVIFLNSGHLAIAPSLYGFAIKTLLMFASVTGVFYVLSNPPGGKPFFRPYQCWRPEQLPPVVYNWQRIKPWEQGVEFSSSLFFFLLLHYPLLMSDQVMETLTIGFATPTQQWLPWLAAVVGCSLLFNLWNLRFSYWTRPKLVTSAALNLAAAVLLLCISRLPVIVADSAAMVEGRVTSLDIANQIITSGLFWVGLWLLFECARDIYRAGKLSRVV